MEKRALSSMLSKQDGGQQLKDEFFRAETAPGLDASLIHEESEAKAATIVRKKNLPIESVADREKSSISFKIDHSLALKLQ